MQPQQTLHLVTKRSLSLSLCSTTANRSSTERRMDPLRADAGGDQREPRRCRGTGRSAPRRLIVMETRSQKAVITSLFGNEMICVCKPLILPFVWNKNMKRGP